MVNWKSAIYFILVFHAWTGIYGVVKNDFTKANSAFSAKYNTERNSAFDSSYRNSDKKFPQKMFTPEGDVSRLQNQKAYVPSDNGTGELVSKQYRRSGEKFSVPEYNGKTDLYRKSGKGAEIENIDRDLNRKYEGKIDVNKHSLPTTAQYLQDKYAEMSERSLQDINKYYYQSSRDDTGIPTKIAGGQINGETEDSGMLDFITGDHYVSRPRVSLRGPQTVNKEIIEDEAAVPQPKRSAPEIPSGAAPSAYDNSSAGSASSKAVSLTRKDTSANPPANVKRITEEEFDVDKANSFDFMRVPKDLRSGKAVIKVEVKEE